jgi:hypothetical protein
LSSVSFKFLPEMSDSTEIPSPRVKATGGRTPTEIRHTELHDPLESLEVLQRIAFMIFESSSPEGTPRNRAPSPSTAIGSFWWNSIFPLRSRKMRRFFPATLTVSPFDLAQYRYANDRGKLDQDVASLTTQKLGRQHRLMAGKGREKFSFLVLTKAGKRVLEQLRRQPSTACTRPRPTRSRSKAVSSDASSPRL